VSPAKHGYIELYDCGTYDWVTTQKEVAKALEGVEVEDFIICNSDRTVWVLKEYQGRLNELRAAIEDREQDINDYLGDLYEGLTAYDEEDKLRLVGVGCTAAKRSGLSGRPVRCRLS
jgi:hypothetical protein